MAAFDNLHSDLELLEEFLDSLSKENSGLEITRKFRRFLQSSVVVLLYGAYEEFIESCVEEYVDVSGEISLTNGQPMCKNLIDAHCRRVIEDLRNLQRKNTAGDSRKTDLIKGIWEVSQGNYGSIKGKTFRSHSSNFRFESTNSAFTEIGLNGLLTEVCQRDSSRKRISVDLQREGDETFDRFQNQIKQILAELVESRNCAAHGKMFNLVELRTVKNWLSVVRAICRELSLLTLSKNLEVATQNECIACPLRCQEVIKDSQVAVLEPTQKLEIDPDTSILIVRCVGSSEFRWCRPLEVQIDGRKQSSAFLANKGQQFGAKLEFSVKENRCFFLSSISKLEQFGLPTVDPLTKDNR